MTHPPARPAPSMGDEIARGIAGSRSHIVSALVAFILYFVGFWFIGFITNIVFLMAANRDYRISRRNSPGRVLLLVELWILGFGPILVSVLSVILTVILIVVGVASLAGILAALAAAVSG